MIPMLISMIGRVLIWAVNAYITVLFIRMILDWVSILMPRWYPRGVIAQLINAIYTVTEPPLRWLRRYIPPLPLGAVSLDMSFLVLYFGLIVLESVISFLL